jgi:hypothetical protein
VVSQQPKSGPGPHGNYVAGVEVMIRTGLGNTGSLFVPMADFSPERIRPLAASLAQRLDDVSRLTEKG